MVEGQRERERRYRVIFLPDHSGQRSPSSSSLFVVPILECKIGFCGASCPHLPLLLYTYFARACFLLAFFHSNRAERIIDSLELNGLDKVYQFLLLFQRVTSLFGMKKSVDNFCVNEYVISLQLSLNNYGNIFFFYNDVSSERNFGLRSGH